MLPPGARRSKIRPPRKSLIGQDADTDPKVEYEKAWAVLSSAIKQIQQKNVSNLSYEQLYRKAYSLVLRKHGAKLYEDVSKLVVDHLIHRRTTLLHQTAMLVNEDFMKMLISEWDEHLQLMKFISDVFMYLNRVYVREHKKLLIYDLGIQLFKEHFIKANDNEVGNRLVEIVIGEITKSRKGEAIATKMHVTKVINMFELLIEVGTNNDLQYGENYYQRYFEPVFLTRSETFFYWLADDLMSSNNGSKYLTNASQFIKDEEARTNLYLPSSTHPKIVSLMDNIIIKDKIDKVMSYSNEQEGLNFWLEPVLANLAISRGDALFIEQETHHGHHLVQLRALYELVGRIDLDRNLLKARLKQAVISQGHRLPLIVKQAIEKDSDGLSKKAVAINSTPFALKWVELVLELQNQYEHIVKELFARDIPIEQCIQGAMKEFINGLTSAAMRASGKNSEASSINGAEILSIYMDHHIKQITKSASSKASASVDRNDDFIKQSITFLRFIKDKDAFEAHYANHFAKRFLNSKASAKTGSKLGNDIEELVISKLCEEIGSTSLDKVIKMNKDVKLSLDLTSEWKGYNKDGVVDMDLKICNVSEWPKSMTKDYKSFSRQDGSFIWPKLLRDTIREFEEFWFTAKKNDNKTLFWCPKFGSMDLRITYPLKTYDINMSTYAGIIMLLFAPQSYGNDGQLVSAFEERRRLTYVEIRELTGIPEADLKRQLQSIAVAPRTRLLVKTPMSKDVNATDVFCLNDKFRSPSAKVKVLTVSGSTGTKLLKAQTKSTEVDEEKEEVQQAIVEGRKHMVNAAIVRIMKSRQSVKHNELVAELVKQLHGRFQPLTILMKQRIEDLIEKEYLKRDDDDRTVYHYVA